MIEQATRAETGSQRFRRADRIRSGRDYARIRRIGRRSSGENLSIEIAAHHGRPRLGLVIGKRVGNAIVRVRVKRAVREWFRTRRNDWIRGLDVVVVARAGAESLTTAEIWQALDATFAQAER